MFRDQMAGYKVPRELCLVTTMVRSPAGKADYVVSADLKGVKTKDGQPLHLAEEVDAHVEYDERVDIGLHLTR